MTPQEFVNRAIGLPWVRWRSDWQAMDCFGLLSLYHRDVLGIEIEAIRQAGSIHGFGEWKDWGNSWKECGQEDGATCFMAWRDGAPTHCGILLPGSMLLHSEGSPDHPGSVRVTRLSVMQRAYGDIKFYRYTKC